MRLPKGQKIDLTTEYPCPCRRRGNLKPIVLMDAMGCDRCQQIFTVNTDDGVIEQVSTIYQKKSWRWTGNRWKNAYARWTHGYLSLISLGVFISSIFTIVILPPLLRWLGTQSIISWTVVILFLVMLLILSLFVVYRH